MAKKKVELLPTDPASRATRARANEEAFEREAAELAKRMPGVEIWPGDEPFDDTDARNRDAEWAARTPEERAAFMAVIRSRLNYVNGPHDDGGEDE